MTREEQLEAICREQSKSIDEFILNLKKAEDNNNFLNSLLRVSRDDNLELRLALEKHQGVDRFGRMTKRSPEAERLRRADKKIERLQQALKTRDEQLAKSKAFNRKLMNANSSLRKPTERYKNTPVPTIEAFEDTNE